MSDGEPGRMTNPPPVVRLEICLLAEAVHAFLELLYDIVLEVRSIQHEHACGLDQVHVGRGQSVNVILCLGEYRAGPIRLFQPLISAPPVILQSTHEAALDVVDLADLKRQVQELS